MKQEVIENEKIFYTLRTELLKAKREIIVVTAWFTDSELLEILSEKLVEGVKVTIVISDNKENSNVDYSSIIHNGGQIFKVKLDRGGMMHQKFCIIDSLIAIHGSYNWTYNARNRNNESVILTDHSETIQTLKKTFKDLIEMNQASGQENKSFFNKIFNREKSPSDTSQEENAPDAISENDFSPVKELENILEEMIESELFKFDKSALSGEGFDRAKLTNGDHQTLPNTLDTLYADFVNSLDIAQDRKDALYVKIKELKKSKTNKLQIEQDREINIIESEEKAKEEALLSQIQGDEAKIEQNNHEINKIISTEIDSLRKTNEDLNKDIENLEIEFVKSKIRWYELVPAMLSSIILLGYLVIFYSSAAYILIFSKIDAEMAQLKKLEIVPPEIFDPEALSKGLEKGGTALLFMTLFVIIPVTLAIIQKFLPNIKAAGKIIIWSGIFIVDAFVAIVVSQSIHTVEYMRGSVTEEWKLNDIFGDLNFYLVFIFGSLGLVLFKVVYEKIHLTFEERNKDATRAKNKKVISNIKKKIVKNEKEIIKLEVQIEDIKKQTLVLEASIREKNHEKGALPVSYGRKKQALLTEFELRISEIEDIITLYINRIENNDLKFSTSALKDRINTFIEGWINYLHDTYSVHKATEMSINATNTKNIWLDTKIKDYTKQIA